MLLSAATSYCLSVSSYSRPLQHYHPHGDYHKIKREKKMNKIAKKSLQDIKSEVKIGTQHACAERLQQIINANCWYIKPLLFTFFWQLLPYVRKNCVLAGSPQPNAHQCNLVLYAVECQGHRNTFMTVICIEMYFILYFCVYFQTECTYDS